MPDLACIELGGLLLRTYATGDVFLTRHHDADYDTFRRNNTGNHDDKDVISIRLDPDTMPSLDDMRSLREKDTSWSIFSRGDNQRMVVLQSPVAKSPMWQMLIELGSNNVVVYCGDAMVTRVNGRTETMNPVSYPLDLVLMMYALAERSGVIVHSTGIALDGRGFLFPGVSGAGKSTLTRLFSSTSNAVRLSDDRIIVRDTGSGPRMFGTPWLGEAGVCADGNAPLSAILFLKKSSTNSLTKLDQKQAIERLMPVASVPWYDRDLIAPILTTCEKIVSKVPAYDFGFTPTSDAVEFLKTLQAAS